MAQKQLNNIFLSASVPSPGRNKIFYDTADVIAIRDAVRALATVVVPYANLIWGGHPSITPLIKYILELLAVDVKSHVKLYQSLFFYEKFPSENSFIENVIFTPKLSNIPESIAYLRKEMIEGNNFAAAIFIGGMEGINDEYEIFKAAHPNALIIPVASTGAAAKILFNKNSGEYDKRLSTDYAYMSLFNDLLKSVL